MNVNLNGTMSKRVIMWASVSTSTTRRMSLIVGSN